MSEDGVAVHDEWLRTTRLRPGVEADAFVIMPNHLHGVIVITDRTGALPHAPTDSKGVLPYAPTGTFRSPSQTIGAVVRGFKSASTKRINEIHHTPGRPVWQPNFYEHVIRNEDDLNRIREYILTNPARWAEDENHPDLFKQAADRAMKELANGG